LNKHKWWHEYLIDVVAWLTGLNMIEIFLEMCFCKTYTYVFPILVVELILSLVLLCVIHKVALEMDMVEK
jgi:hypothetical protein